MPIIRPPSAQTLAAHADQRPDLPLIPTHAHLKVGDLLCGQVFASRLAIHPRNSHACAAHTLSVKRAHIQREDRKAVGAVRLETHAWLHSQSRLALTLLDSRPVSSARTHSPAESRAQFFFTYSLCRPPLTQLMAGANSILSAAGCALVGGHSSEGAELSAGGEGSLFGEQRPPSARKHMHATDVT